MQLKRLSLSILFSSKHVDRWNTQQVNVGDASTHNQHSTPLTTRLAAMHLHTIILYNDDLR